MLILLLPRVSAHNGRAVSDAAGTQQHPGHTAFPCRVKCTDHPLTLRKIKRAFLHREEEKRLMNVIFYLCFQLADVGSFVLDMHS